VPITREVVPDSNALEVLCDPNGRKLLAPQSVDESHPGGVEVSQAADSTIDSHEDRCDELRDQIERYSLELEEMEGLRPNGEDYEAFLSTAVKPNRQIVRCANLTHPNAIHDGKRPTRRIKSAVTLVALALMEEERFQIRLQRLTTEIQTLRSEMRWNLRYPQRPLEPARIKYKMDQFEMQREDLVYQADQLMLYGVPDNYYEAHAQRARLRMIVKRKFREPFNRTEVSLPEPTIGNVRSSTSRKKVKRGKGRSRKTRNKHQSASAAAISRMISLCRTWFKR